MYSLNYFNQINFKFFIVVLLLGFCINAQEKTKSKNPTEKK